ncbi:xylose ABC transporter ATP-binding protein [Christensenella intestinihominis]|uniref:xylose ABC transporter ATP-binding protein n=1 Tax=Christensenella intestinihominis TaxID=1851429 RepID=UPI00082CB1CA|nr:xylose ABC transporter ATP-binding protein [Christensenella intestinihominis]
MSDNILEMRDITKSFSGIKALSDVNFTIKRGEIHALCGENGAGKSTLMKVLSGVWPCGSYEGKIILNEKECEFHNVRESEQAGIAIIYQELALVSEMDAGENVFLNAWHMKNGLIDFPSVYYHTKQICQELKMNIDPTRKVREFGVGIQQLIEIAKALAKKADILVLDEPTASLTESEVDILMEFLRGLKEKGVTCIYISHKLDEVLNISDNVTVLRDGKTVGTYQTAGLDEAFLIRQMVGRELSDRFPYKTRELGETVFEVENYNVMKEDDRDKKMLDDISFSVRKGEIVGISGLMGSGRTELALSLFGFLKGKKTGNVRLRGKETHIDSPSDAIRKGLGMVSEDRKRLGLFLDQSVVKNIVAASLPKISRHGVIDENEQIYLAKKYEEELKIKTPSLQADVKSLSGGNQQKVVLAKWLMTEPDVLFLDEPTRGIDVGAKYEIYNIMMDLAKRGVAIIMISSELPEVLGMSDRIIVMHEGKITGELSHDEANQEKIMHLATGGEKQ